MLMRSGFGNCAGSRFVAPMQMVMRESGGSETPPTSTFYVVIRGAATSWVSLAGDAWNPTRRSRSGVNAGTGMLVALRRV